MTTINKVKPFFIRITDDMTPQIVQDALDKCVSAGVTAYEMAIESNAKHKYRNAYNIKNWNSFGVNICNQTCFWDVYNEDDGGKFGGMQNEITLDQLDAHLGIERDTLDMTDTTSKQVEILANCSELPNSSDWDGKGLPPVGSLCKVNRDPFVYRVMYSSEYVVIVQNLDNDNTEAHGMDIILDLHKGDYVFSKPETPKQREDRERAEAIYEMCSAADVFNEESHFWAGKFYDLGYRK